MLSELDRLAQDFPERPALRWLDLPGAPTWTYGAFASRAAGVAQELLARGLKAGDAVGVVGGNAPAWVLLQEACAWLRLTFVPIGPKLVGGERDFLLQNASVALALGDPALPPGKCPVESWAWCEAAWAETFPARPQAAPGGQLLYTSGSGGIPKGVRRSRDSDDARMRQSIAVYGLQVSDRHLVAGPLYHSGPSIFFRMFRRLGASQAILSHFDPERVAGLLAAGEVDCMFMVPTMWRMLLAERRNAAWAPKLKAAFIAGSATEPELREALLAALGEGVLWEFYGATETGTVAILPPDKQKSHGHTVGFPPPETEVRVIGADGQGLPRGKTGRIYVKSPTTMLGYHRGPGSAPDIKEDVLPGGWVSVGDLGSLTEDGAIVLLGREQGMIITGGINVYPEEVEAAIKKIEGVLEAVVFGLPDATWGQKICALVEPRSESPLAAEQLKLALRQHLADFKIPKEIRVLARIPRTPSEKVVRAVESLARFLVS